MSSAMLRGAIPTRGERESLLEGERRVIPQPRADARGIHGERILESAYGAGGHRPRQQRCESVANAAGQVDQCRRHGNKPGRPPKRYCHLADDAELAALLSGLPARTLAAWTGDDGRGWRNRYFALARA